MEIVTKTFDYLYNHIAKSCARDVYDGRHDYGEFKRKEVQSNVPDPWRIPVIDTHRQLNQDNNYYFNDVTFIYPFDFNNAPQSIKIVGTFHKLYEPIVLQRLQSSRYFTVTCSIPKSEVHYYKYLVDGKPLPDPINSQRQVLDNGEEWSRFFTDTYSFPISFERWEWILLERLTDHILPFRFEFSMIFRGWKNYLSAGVSANPHGGIGFLEYRNLLSNYFGHKKRKEMGRSLEPWNLDAYGNKTNQERFENFMSVEYMDLHILKPSCGIGIHRHRDNQEIFFMMEGQGLMIVGDWNKHDDRERCFEVRTMSTGDLTLCKTGQLHALLNLTDMDCKLFMFGGYD